jgi:hypothetical protein
MHKEFTIAIGAGDGRVDPSMHDASARFEGCMDFVLDTLMDGGISDHTVRLGDFHLAGLELRLHEQHEMTTGTRSTHERIEHPTQRDEREVGHHQIDGTTEQFRSDITNVEAFEDRHLFMLSDARMQLAMAHVDRSNPIRASLEQAVGESTGGGASVERRPTGDIKPKCHERTIELLATAADESWTGALHNHRITGVHLPRGFVGDCAVHQHPTGIDRLRRLHPALDEPATH